MSDDKPNPPPTEKTSTETKPNVIANIVVKAARTEKVIRKRFDRIGGEVPMMLAGMLDYLVGEIVEVSYKKRTERSSEVKGRKSLSARDIRVGIEDDPELNKLIGHVTIPNSGHYIPKYRSERPKKEKKAEKRLAIEAVNANPDTAIMNE